MWARRSNRNAEGARAPELDIIAQGSAPYSRILPTFPSHVLSLVACRGGGGGIFKTKQLDFPDTRQNREENKLARRHVRLVIDHLQPSFED
jgi:hypothetical protein